MDNNLIKKVMTFKSGKFVFSRKFSSEKLTSHLIEARILYNTVTDLPILPELSTRLEEEIIRKSIFGTAALEGNPLSEDRVGQIISGSDKEEQVVRAEKEIRNLKAAYDFIASQRATDSVPELSETMIQKVHALITQDVEYKYNMPGKYRGHPVKVRNMEHGGVYVPPKCLADIKTLMKEYITWINSKEILDQDPAIRAALAHYHLALIHPFGDGNGRTARLVEALLLRLGGIKYVPIMLSNFYYRNIDDYFWAFSNAIKNKEHDVTPFLEFILKGVIDSLNEIKGRITFFIRKFTLRDYYAYLKRTRDISQRQHDLLLILLDYLKPFTLGDLFKIPQLNILYRNVNERTARRDLKRLREKALLSPIKDGGYELNWRILG
ncbi:MAG: Fic family protein [Thermodesulfobacteriota bacterium]